MAFPGQAESFPSYMSFYHRQMLGIDIDTPETPAADWADSRYDHAFITYLEDALDAGNPYLDIVSYDPDTDIMDMESSQSSLNSIASSINPTTTWGSYVDAAVAKMSTAPLSSSDVDNAVDNFERKMMPSFARRINEMTAGMADINAVNGSAFIMGMFLLGQGMNTEVAEYRSKLDLSVADRRMALVLQGAQDMARILLLKMESQKAATAILGDFMKYKIQAKNEKIKQDIDYTVREQTWYVDLHKHGMDMLSAISGMPTVKPALTPEQAMLSNAMLVASTVLPIVVPFL